MSNPSPTVREDAEAIRCQLDTYAKPRGGTVAVMQNLAHLWQEIYVLNENPRILIVWTGEIARGEYEGNIKTDLHRVDRQWTVVVMRGHGFKNMVTESQGSPSDPNYYEDFADSIETVRDGIRVMSNISMEFPVNYKAIRPLPSIGPSREANVFLDCYAVEFSTAADIPRILPNGTTG